MVHVKKLIYYKNIAFVIISILFIIALIYTKLTYPDIKHKDYNLYKYARIDSINDIGRVVDINGNTVHAKIWQPYFTTKYTRPIYKNINNSAKFHFFFYDIHNTYLFTLTDLGDNNLVSLSKLDIDYVKEYGIKKYKNIWQMQTK